MSRRRCIETAKVTGERCRGAPMPGVERCNMHGRREDFLAAELVHAVEGYVEATWIAMGRPRLREWA